MARRIAFGKRREPIELELSGDVFYAPPVIAPVVLGEFLDTQERIVALLDDKNLSQKESLTQTMKALDEVFSLVLVPDSVPRFHERLFSRTEPFDLLTELIPAMEALVEEYTSRPTLPSSPSPNGSNGGGTNSTDGVLLGVSTPQLLTTPAAS